MFNCLKTINTHSGHARFLAELDRDSVDPELYAEIGYINRDDIPSECRDRYHFAPDYGVAMWNGKKVFVSEISNRCFKVFEIPDSIPLHKEPI